MATSQIPKDASPEMRRLIRDAEVPEVTGDTAPEKTDQSGGEDQNRPVRG